LVFLVAEPAVCRSSMVVAGTANVAVMSDTVLGSGVGKRPATFEQMLDISRREFGAAPAAAN
jgi:hypothetical protein